MKEFLYQEMDVVYFDQLIKSYQLPSKKKLRTLFYWENEKFISLLKLRSLLGTSDTISLPQSHVRKTKW